MRAVLLELGGKGGSEGDWPGIGNVDDARDCPELVARAEAGDNRADSREVDDAVESLFDIEDCSLFNDAE